MQLRFNAISEPGIPGEKWKKLFHAFWPAYYAWLNSKDSDYVADLEKAQAALKKYMPKMYPTYERLCKLVDADREMACFLTGFQPPAYISACSQAVLTKGTVQLVRNYDYHPNLLEGTLLMSAWNGKKVIATSDCLIGAVDGMNEDGLAVSLTFGGRKVVGVGFGIPFILRYVLEFCKTVKEAVKVLVSIPTHMSYNVTVIDRSGAFKTLLLSPDHKAVITNAPFTTNHQETIDWPENSSFTKTIEHAFYLQNLMSQKKLSANKLSDAFLKPPLYNTLFDQGFGTLFTAVYKPKEGTVQWRWLKEEISVSFADFMETSRLITFEQPVPYGKKEKVDELLIGIGLSAILEENARIKEVPEEIISKREVPWDVLVDIWSNIGKK